MSTKKKRLMAELKIGQHIKQTQKISQKIIDQSQIKDDLHHRALVVAGKMGYPISHKLPYYFDTWLIAMIKDNRTRSTVLKNIFSAGGSAIKLSYKKYILRLEEVCEKFTFL